MVLIRERHLKVVILFISFLVAIRKLEVRNDGLLVSLLCLVPQEEMVTEL